MLILNDLNIHLNLAFVIFFDLLNVIVIYSTIQKYTATVAYCFEGEQ